MTPTIEVLKGAAEAFKGARRNVMEGARLLHQISKEGLWQGKYDSFSEFVELECQIKASFASKLVQVWERYAIQGGIDMATLKEVESEKLYLAAKLPGDPEKQFATAQTLSRQELRNEISDPNDECTHANKISICGACGKRV